MERGLRGHDYWCWPNGARPLGTRIGFFGCFHYARPTGQRPVGLTEENGTTFSDQTGPTERNGSYHFLFLSRIPYMSEMYWREVGQRNRFVKMERLISVRPVRPIKVDHLQRWSRIFRSDRTETDLSIWLPTEISGFFGIMESTLFLFPRFSLKRELGHA